MAYTKTLMCRVAYCGKPARIEVFTWRNESVGMYCAGCGKVRLGEIKQQEASAPVDGHFRAGLAEEVVVSPTRKRLYVPEGTENGPPKDDYRRRLIGYVVDEPISKVLDLEIVTFSEKERAESTSRADAEQERFLTWATSYGPSGPLSGLDER